jgi:hypothetical protein
LIWPANVSPQPDLIWEPKALNTPPVNDTLFIWAAEKSGSSSKRAGTTIDVGLPDNISAEETRKEINSTVDKINKSDGDERFGNLLKLLSLVENIPNLKK